jgi:hypothetical protein
MALTRTDRGSGNNNVSGTSIVITPGSNFTAGSIAIVCVACDNSGASGADPFSSITDSVGNRWNRIANALYDPGAASAGVSLWIFWSHMTVAALTTGNTITVTINTAAVAKAWTLQEVTTDLGGLYRPEVSGSGVNTGAASGTPTVTTESLNSGDCIIGCGGAESGNTWAGDADTTNGSWSTQQSNAAGTGATGMSITSQGKIVTASGTQTYNPTLTSADVILAWVSVKEEQVLQEGAQMFVGGY